MITEYTCAHSGQDHPEPLLIFSFWADWCSSCNMLKPVLHLLEREFGHRINIVPINVDERKEEAGQFNVRYIPALVFVRKGIIVGQHSGAAPFNELHAKLSALTI